MNVADRRPRLRGIRFLLALLGILAVGLPTGLLTAGPTGVAAATFTPSGATSGTIMPGVHVGSIDLSGLDETAARQVLGDAFAYVGQGQVTLTADTNTATITYSSIGRHVDIDKLIAEAFAVGRESNAITMVMQTMQTTADGMSLEPTVVFDEVSLRQQVTDFAAIGSTPAVNARAIRTTTGYTTIPSQMGHGYDASAVLPQLITQLHDPAAPSTLAVTLTAGDLVPAITDEEAQAARANAAAMSFPLVLANSGETWTIPENVVHSWISFRIVDGTSIEVAFNDALIQKALVTLSKKINRPAVNASWAFGVNGVRVVPSTTGRVMDIARTSRRVQVFLEGRAAGTISTDRKLGPTVTVTNPKLTTAQAQAQSSKFKLLSTWTTYFAPAAHNGFGANIWVPAGYLDNQVVQPGETFSFWDRVGEVSLARGYKMGGAIVNGQTREGVALAGGICSTSTTLFNAALRAGLKMGQRSNHYYYIKRYPVGLDATVSKTQYGQQDMTFTNDTAYPILVKSFKTGGSVSFSLYGIPTGRTVTFSKPTIKNYRPATQEIVRVSTLPPGRLVRIEYPDDGFDAWVTRFVRDSSGALIDQRTFYSHYSMVKGVQYLGDPNGRPLTVPSYAPGAQGG
jgi:vancomycin resistance protein YoaR